MSASKTVSTMPASTRFGEAEWQRRVDLAACYRLADRFGLSEIVWNHITARVPGAAEHFLLNRFGLRFDEITASSLVKVDLEGNVVDGPEDLNVTGFVIHSAVHAAREDVVCVMHSHGPGGLAVSALADGFIPMTQDGFMFYERVAYHDYEGLSTDTSECQRLATNLGDKDVMVLRNHGLLTVGSSVGEAFMRMYYLERACQTQMKILASGAKTELPPVAVREHARRQYAQFPPGKHEWPALLRMLDEQSPGYRE